VTDAAPAAEPRPTRWRASRVALAVAVVLMVAMWGYVVYLAVGPGRQPPPDRLEDPAFADAAQEVCRAALVDVGLLPPAVSAPDAAARLLVTARDREQVTEFIDAFAKDNDMPACATPLDVS